MKIGILQAESIPKKMKTQYGEYDNLFKVMLAERGFDFATYPVFGNCFPNKPDDADGWLITGSKFGAYENYDWISRLEDFLRQTYAAEKPIVGICFGHQILAQALGGKVEKFSGGWVVGAVEYNREGITERVMAWHQDQVITLPEDAEVIGSNDSCDKAMLRYGNKALTFQHHPEFTNAFFADLLIAEQDSLPEDIVARAKTTMHDSLDSSTYADLIATFFQKNKAHKINDTIFSYCATLRFSKALTQKAT